MTQALKNLTKESAIVLRAELGPVFTPRFFCCDNPNALGISEGKTPVCGGTLTPSPARVGETITYDATKSYDPDGTITGYSWDFPGGTPPSSTTATGSVTYATPGRKVVTLKVTDGTSLVSSPCVYELEIVDPAGAFFMATSKGPWATVDGGQTWTSIIGDLPAQPEVTDARDIAQDPNGPLWLATAGGVFVSIDGGQRWYNQTPSTPGSGDRTGQIFHIIHIAAQDLYVGSYLGTDQSFIYVTSDWRDVRSDPTASLEWIDFWENP